MKKIKRSNHRMVLISIIGIITSIALLGYFIYYSIGSEAKGRGKAYYWHYESTPRYCYDPNDPSTCHYGNLSTSVPKNKEGTGEYIKVYVKKGGACPKGDFQIINEQGTVIDCFGGTREKNKLFKKLK